MPKPRKNERIDIPISVSRSDKDKLRKLARPVKKTRNGTTYETDAAVFHRIINFYIESKPNEVGEAHPTYPTKSSSASP